MTHRRVIPLLLFVLVWLSCAWFGSWEYNANNATRLYAAISLAEDGDATIDEFAPLTIDKARFGDHFYLDKAPGMTLMAVPIIAMIDAVTGERATTLEKWVDDPGLTRFLRLRMRIVAALTSGLLTAIAAALLYDLALGLTARASAALFAALGYALGTPIWGWSTTIFGHAPVATLYVIAVWAIWRATRDAAGRPGMAMLAGVALGWAVVVEYQAVLAGGAIGLWALWRVWRRADRWRLIAMLLIGGVVALIPLLAYNLLAFGTPFRIAYSGVVGFEGMNQGLFGLTTPKMPVLWSILFGLRRGFLWVSPVSILAPIGLLALIGDRRTRAMGVMACAVVLVTLLLNAAYVYWDGGNSTGPRLAMPMAGLLALGLAPLWTMLWSPAARIAAAMLLGGSIVLNAVIAAAEILAPPTFTDPIWEAVIVLRFLPGDLRDLPSVFLGWSPWAGFGLYAAIALAFIAALIRAVWLADARTDA